MMNSQAEGSEFFIAIRKDICYILNFLIKTLNPRGCCAILAKSGILGFSFSQTVLITHTRGPNGMVPAAAG